MSGAPDDTASFREVSLRWYVRVRWGAGLTELALALAMLGSGRPRAWTMLLAAVPTLASNAWLARRDRPPSEARLLGLTLVDLAALAAFLGGAGGPANPWSALFVVYVALASVLLRPQLALGVVVAGAVAYRATFLAGDPHAGHGGAFDEHLEGMYVAYVVSSALVAFFLSRTAEALHARDLALAEARERAARTARVAALTTLAAGAAHELGSPLGTIAVAARELERELVARELDATLVEDAKLVREEVSRCRDILDRMATEAGALVGEVPKRASLHAVFEELRQRKGARHARVRYALRDADLRLPVAAVQSIVENLVANALHASPTGEVDFAAGREGDELVVTVRDHGVGMDDATRARAFDPFFTTKPPGEGTGLGLFLVDAMVTELGGRIRLESSLGAGTEVEVRLPAEVGRR